MSSISRLSKLYDIYWISDIHPMKRNETGEPAQLCLLVVTTRLTIVTTFKTWQSLSVLTALTDQYGALMKVLIGSGAVVFQDNFISHDFRSLL